MSRIPCPVPDCPMPAKAGLMKRRKARVTRGFREMIEQTCETPATGATVRGHGRSTKEIDVSERTPAVKLCECGCGQPTRIATRSIPSLGHIKGQPIRFVRGHSGAVRRSNVTECRVEGCEGKPSSRELCQKHYTRLLRTGSTDPGPMAHAGPEERFWRHVQKSEGCWPWSGHVNNNGYGTFAKSTASGAVGRHMYAHRFSYELHHGPIPEGGHVLHACDNPPCVNPAHLRIGTALDNLRDASAKDRIAHGDHHPHAKLTAERVREILALKESDTLTRRQIADRFGVSTTTIGAIFAGRTWTRVTAPVRASTKEGA